MGYGTDEAWLPEDEPPKPTGEELHAMEVFGMDEEQWFHMPYMVRREKLWVSKFFKEGKQ